MFQDEESKPVFISLLEFMFHEVLGGVSNINKDLIGNNGDIIQYSI